MELKLEFEYMVKKKALGLQNQIANIITDKGEPLTVDDIALYLPPVLSRGSILRAVQELELKNILYVDGKESRSNKYYINKSTIVYTQ